MTTGAGLAAAVLVGLAVWSLLAPPAAWVRLRGLDLGPPEDRGAGPPTGGGRRDGASLRASAVAQFPRPRSRSGTGSRAGAAASAQRWWAAAPAGADGRSSPGRGATFAAAAAGLCVAVVLGGGVGVAVGLAAGVGLRRWLNGLETAAERRERARLAADVPLIAELLAATLGAGVPLGGAIDAVATSVGGPLGERLSTCRRADALGVAPRRAWAPLLDEPSAAPLARLLLLTTTEGTAPAAALAAMADDVRARARAAAEARARAVGASVAAPLGLCFLPAFLLLGVVPLVASAASALFP